MASGFLNKQQTQSLAEHLTKKTKFSRPECECLLNMFRSITSKNKIDRTRFRDILHNDFEITDDVILDRVFKAFDRDNDGYINTEEWVKGLSIFLRGSNDEKRKFCFEVYDMNGDGFISRDEMFHLLKTSIVKQTTDEDPDEGVKDIVEVVLKKMDHDHDARLSYKDYSDTVEEECLLLEAFGQCLPSEKKAREFLSMIESRDQQQQQQ